MSPPRSFASPSACTVTETLPESEIGDLWALVSPMMFGLELRSRSKPSESLMVQFAAASIRTLPLASCPAKV